MAEAVDRRSARTRKALHGALMALILRKDYEATTIQDIIDEADIGRSTFYSHFTGKEDLLRSGFQTLRRELADAQRVGAQRAGSQRPGAARSGRSEGKPLGFSLAMFEHAGEYKQIYRALVGGRGGVIAVNELRRALSDAVKKDMADAADDEAVPQEVRIQFVVAVFLTVLTWWLERRPRLAPSEVDMVFRRLVLNGVR